jgi:hypothetical protein
MQSAAVLHLTRLALAFAVAPGVVPIAAWAILQFGGGVVLATYTYGSTVLFGIPLFLLFRRNRWLRWWHCFAAGALASLPFMAILGGFLFFSSAFHSREAALSSVQLSAMIVGVGAISGLAFWLVAFAGDDIDPAVVANPPAATTPAGH